MAKRKTRKIAKRKSTKRGGIRRTARKAYAPKRRAARSNPKGMMSSPAIRFGGMAALGAGAEVVISQTGLLQKQISKRLYRSAAFAALTVMVGKYLLKGKARQNSYAAAVGMLIPGLTDFVANTGIGTKLKMGEVATATKVAKLTSNPYVVASRHAKAASGLTAIK